MRNGRNDRGHEWENFTVKVPFLGNQRRSRCGTCSVEVFWFSGNRSATVVPGEGGEERRVGTCGDEVIRSVLGS